MAVKKMIVKNLSVQHMEKLLKWSIMKGKLERERERERERENACRFIGIIRDTSKLFFFN